MTRSLLFLFFVAFISPLHANTALVLFDKIEVQMGGDIYQLEHAVTPQQRARGLMFRKQLCDMCGMLFTFRQPRIGSIWMKNTFVPLDLAYVDEQGVITDIFPLTPQDLTSVKSSVPVAYAIEMNQGFFAKSGIKAGDRIVIRSAQSN